jgi:peptidase E
MRGTALIYSSHNRSPYLHDHFIVERALQGVENKRILFLPMSESPQNGNEMERQDFSWGNFRWYFQKFERYGLQAVPFFWSSSLGKEDVDKLWDLLWSSEVVILGGGHSMTGLYRYKELGARFDGEPGKFGRLMHERRQRGLLTVGFSAGADQLCEYVFRRTFDSSNDTQGFGLLRNTMTTLHHEPSRNHELRAAAQKFPHCLVFGLPNDSGLYTDGGVLPSGNHWQVVEFVTDSSWDDPSDYWHIKTRAGALIEHVYCDGRHWSFHGGERMLRIQSPDNHFHQVWFTHQGQLLHYWTQKPTFHNSFEEILASY